MKIVKKENNSNADYFKVIAQDDSREVDVLLYGVIGKRKSWWEENEDDITDIAFARKMKELEANYDRINVRINSPGGSVFHGNAIVTAIQISKAEVHTYNDGLCASQAAIIWVSAAAKNRHKAKNATTMFHSPSTYAGGNAKQMRATADMLDILENTAINILSDALGETKEKVKASYFDGSDHWKSYEDMASLSLVSAEDEEYEVEDLVVTASEKVTMMDVMSRFAERGDKQAQSFLQHIKEKSKQLVAIAQKAASFTHNKNSLNMNVKELKDALATGKLTIEEVNAILAEQKAPAAPAPAPVPPVAPVAAVPPVVPAAPAAQPDLAATVAAAVAKALKPLQDANKLLTDTNTTLAEKVIEYGGKPGGTPSGVAAGGDPTGEEGDAKPFAELDAFTAEMNSIAASHGSVDFK